MNELPRRKQRGIRPEGIQAMGAFLSPTYYFAAVAEPRMKTLSAWQERQPISLALCP
jgi:hypothetical protein